MRTRAQAPAHEGRARIARADRCGCAIAVLLALIFSKYFYLASLYSYYTFYLIERFHVGVRDSQIYLFVFLGAVALGTLVGGPIGDRIGRKYVIWASILGVLPFTLIAAACEPVLDGRAQRRDRPDPVVARSRRSSSTRRNCCPARSA